MSAAKADPVNAAKEASATMSFFIKELLEKGTAHGPGSAIGPKSTRESFKTLYLRGHTCREYG